MKKIHSPILIKGLAVFLMIVVLVLIQWAIYRKSVSEETNQSESKPVSQTQETKPREITEFYLKIPKLKIEVPIIPNVDGSDETAYLKALESGVAHFAGTALPGEGGNIFIFGHSSYYANQPGNYKTVFKNLNNLQIGDEIVVRFNGQDYVYSVNQKKQVKPSDVEYLAPTSSEQLSLMTCWPPGTTSYRLIVIALLKP